LVFCFFLFGFKTEKQKNQTDLFFFKFCFGFLVLKQKNQKAKFQNLVFWFF